MGLDQSSYATKKIRKHKFKSENNTSSRRIEPTQIYGLYHIQVKYQEFHIKN